VTGRPMVAQNLRLGVWLMIGTTLVFSIQDGFSRHLADSYNVWMVVMIRYWFFAAFVIALASRAPGGLRVAVATRQPTRSPRTGPESAATRSG
jgi:hypothetical protein